LRIHVVRVLPIALRHVTAVALLFALAGCRDATAPTVHELACTNAITPPAFRTVNVLGDTTAWTNRYVVPHRTADTISMALTGGGTAQLVMGNSRGDCWTLHDSLGVWGGRTGVSVLR
jgi:hypothetical protein